MIYMMYPFIRGGWWYVFFWSRHAQLPGLDQEDFPPGLPRLHNFQILLIYIGLAILHTGGRHKIHGHHFLRFPGREKLDICRFHPEKPIEGVALYVLLFTLENEKSTSSQKNNHPSELAAVPFFRAIAVHQKSNRFIP